MNYKEWSRQADRKSIITEAALSKNTNLPDRTEQESREATPFEEFDNQILSLLKDNNIKLKKKNYESGNGIEMFECEALIVIPESIAGEDITIGSHENYSIKLTKKDGKLIELEINIKGIATKDLELPNIAPVENNLNIKVVHGDSNKDGAITVTTQSFGLDEYKISETGKKDLNSLLAKINRTLSVFHKDFDSVVEFLGMEDESTGIDLEVISDVFYGLPTPVLEEDTPLAYSHEVEQEAEHTIFNPDDFPNVENSEELARELKTLFDEFISEYKDSVVLKEDGQTTEISHVFKHEVLGEDGPFSKTSIKITQEGDSITSIVAHIGNNISRIAINEDGSVTNSKTPDYYSEEDAQNREEKIEASNSDGIKYAFGEIINTMNLFESRINITNQKPQEHIDSQEAATPKSVMADLEKVLQDSGLAINSNLLDPPKLHTPEIIGSNSYQYKIYSKKYPDHTYKEDPHYIITYSRDASGAMTQLSRLGRGASEDDILSSIILKGGQLYFYADGYTGEGDTPVIPEDTETSKTHKNAYNLIGTKNTQSINKIIKNFTNGIRLIAESNAKLKESLSA